MNRVHEPILIEISPGGLIDRITILQIKSHRMTDVQKVTQVQAQLEALQAIRRRCLPVSRELDELSAGLSAVNETLWQVEDQLRQCEADEDFGPRFIQLARSVYRHNDHRHAMKQKIDSLAKARVFEEKSYPTY